MTAGQDARERVERLGRPLNALVTVLPASSGAAHGVSGAAPGVSGSVPDADGAAPGPLAGMPVAVKDLFDVAGQPRGNGNPHDEHGAAASADSAIVAALRAAGADVVATASLLEYAAGAQHPDLPEARNPIAPWLTAGGSSGGSAALVGAGAVPVAIGSDTGGSIRLPAHYCEVVGFKPTFGALPLDGAQPLAPSLDHAGLLAVDVDTTIRVFEALTGTAAITPARPIRVGVLAGQLADPRMDADVAEVVNAAIDALAAHPDTVTLVETSSDDLDRTLDHMGVIIGFEAWQVHRDAMTTDPHHFGPETARLFATASTVSDTAYHAALSARADLTARIDAATAGFDVLIGPAAPYVAPEFSPPIDTPAGEVEGIFSGPYNMTGQPAIVIPAGRTDAGLPVGIQLAAARGADALLLGVARVIETLVASARADTQIQPTQDDPTRANPAQDNPTQEVPACSTV